MNTEIPAALEGVEEGVSDPLGDLRFEPPPVTEEDRRKFSEAALRATLVVNEELWHGMDLF